MFKVKGATVYPSEVEAALQSLPAVRRAYVVDVEHDGTRAVAAAVVPAPGAAYTVESLERDAKAQLSAFKVPTRWAIIDAGAVPTTATGKVDKAALQGLFR